MKNFKKKMCITFSILFFICFSNTLRFIPIADSEEIDSLKLSANEIDIITPENKTYTAPMSGFYAATYDFDDKVDGTRNEDTGFIDLDSSGSGSYFETSSNFLNHNKVLKAVDGAGLSGFNGIHYFDKTASTGTIEFWYAIDNVAIVNGMAIRFYGDGGHAWYINCYTGNFRSNGWVGMGTALANQWYHIKMVFNCSLDKVDIYIDGEFERTVDFAVPTTQIEYVEIESDPRYDTSITGYLDAFGLSWDENYKIGDNLYEGLLLGYENSTQLDWIGYSLDDKANITIMGNKTISMPSNGTHKIQVFGNDTFGAMYQSEKRYFTMYYEPINLISPENKSYTTDMDGYYSSTFGFENDANGVSPEGWVNQDASGCTSQIISGIGGHNKVLRQTDNSAGFSAVLRHTFGSTQDHGTIEFFVRTTTFSGGTHVSWYLWSASGYEIWITMVGSKLTYFDGAIWHDIVPSGLTANTWYHLSVRWRNTGALEYEGLAEGEWKIFVDKVEYGNYTLNHDDDMTNVNLETGPGYSGFNVYWDDIVFDWDIREEGILLNFNSITTLDWMAYSLDGQQKQTISGNSTIPIQNNGLHSIQVFGKDSLGDLHRSEVRYFQTYFDAYVPDIPTNVLIRDGWEHIYMSWDVPNDNDAPITHYNIYRGEVENGSKILLDTSTISEYNDTTAVVGIMHYYYISAVNILGESGNSTEVSGIAWDAPFVRWRTPEEGALVILPPGDAIFNFVYDWGVVTDVKLIIINATDDEHDFGSVFNQTSHILTPWSNSTEGPITAELRGFNGTDLVAVDSRNFTLAKLVEDVDARLDSNTTIIGNVLYMILHDPNGDNSYSSFSETTTLSMGMSSQITSSIAGSVKVGAEFNLFGYEAGASLKVTAKATEESGYDYRYEVVDKTELTSSLDSSNKDYIGPGYGDRYWGEAWIYKWVLNASYREYFNSTKRYEDPKLYYGVIRDAEVILNDYNAPDEWRALNPVHNGWQNVEWGPPINHDGGQRWYESQEVTTTEKRTHSFEIGLDSEAWLKVGIVETTLNISLNVKNYVEHSEINTYETACEIYDDESTDTISMMSGIDLTFGTYIFNTTTFFCETSNPLEHDTTDYIAPIIEFPNIDLDSNDDGIAPGSNDLPIITVDIFEEGAVSEGYIRYSTNNGGLWNSALLSEQVANPGTWEGTIPAQSHGTLVLWYIHVWDTAGLNSTRKNPTDEPYSYTIINSVPTVSVNTPNGGEHYQNTVRIEWSDFDIDDDDLSVTIAYNLGGVGWHLIVTNTTGAFYDWDISSLAYSDSVLIKVIVNDGFGGETEDISDFVFTIGEPPVEEVPPDTMMFIIVASTIGGIGLVSVITIILIRKRK